MNTRGIPAQSEDENLEKEYSYTVNESTGERIPYGKEAKSEPKTTPPPTGSGNETRRSREQSKEQSGRKSD